MRAAGYGLLLAIQFLTRLPVPIECPWNRETSRWALRCYPLVGALIGALLAGVALLLQDLPAPLLALVLLSLWVALTGGLHLDGLMDIADALGSNTPLERRWAIMKDPQVGSFGILSLVFLLAWKGVLLWALLDIDMPLWLLVAVPALGRFGAVALLGVAPCARREGLAWAWQQHLRHRDIGFAALPLVLITLGSLFGSPGLLPGWVFMVAGLLIFLVGYGGLMIRTFKGINGDMVGAAIEGGELCLLLIAWSWWWSAMG